mmetsp:Transcript_61950/g.183018  ORF Transcript_61950/g.183018 Transcript_61950/m.183018 type:complete len:84 (-) Transcript_61950:5-256(-)
MIISSQAYCSALKMSDPHTRTSLMKNNSGSGTVRTFWSSAEARLIFLICVPLLRFTLNGTSYICNSLGMNAQGVDKKADQAKS